MRENHSPVPHPPRAPAPGVNVWSVDGDDSRANGHTRTYYTLSQHSWNGQARVIFPREL